MALPFINQEVVANQKESLQNQSTMIGGISNVASQLNNQTQILGRVENWLDQTYELHKEYYDLQREDRREAARARKKMGASGASSIGSGSGTDDGGGGFALPVIAGLAVGALSNAIGGINNRLVKLIEKLNAKITKAGTNLETGGRKVDDAAKKVKGSGTKLDEAADDFSNKTKKTADRVKITGQQVADDALKLGSKLDDAGRTGKLGAVLKIATESEKAGGVSKWLDSTTSGKIVSKTFGFATFIESIAANAKDGWDIASAELDQDVGTRVKKEDLGGVIGGAIGGAVGLVFGPGGVWLGLSLGNWVGETIGKIFDDEDFRRPFTEGDQELANLRELNGTRMAALIEDKKNLSDEEFEQKKREIKAEYDNLDNKREQYTKIQKLEEEAQSARVDANKYFDTMEKQIKAGNVTAVAEFERLENIYLKKEQVFQDAAKLFLDPVGTLREQGILDEQLIGGAKVSKENIKNMSSQDLMTQISLGKLNGGTLKEMRAELVRRGESVSPLDKLEELKKEQKILSQMGGEASMMRLNAINKEIRQLESGSADVSGDPNQTRLTGGGRTDFNFKSYMSKVAEKESAGSGGYKAIGGSGRLYLGKYQMGSAALEDAGMLRAGSYDKDGADAWKKDKNWVGVSGHREFLNSPSIQDRAFKRYTMRNKKTLMDAGIIDKNTDSGTVAGYLAASHLLGAGAIIDDKMNTADGFGTRGTEYFNLGAASQGSANLLPSGGGGSKSGGTAGADFIGASMGQEMASGQVNVNASPTVMMDQSVNQTNSSSMYVNPNARNTHGPGVRTDEVRPWAR